MILPCQLHQPRLYRNAQPLCKREFQSDDVKITAMNMVMIRLTSINNDSALEQECVSALRSCHPRSTLFNSRIWGGMGKEPGVCTANIIQSSFPVAELPFNAHFCPRRPAMFPPFHTWGTSIEQVKGCRLSFPSTHSV